MIDLLPWHRAQWDRMSALRAGDRFPHALLLRGPEGVGKERFAQRLARALLCLGPAGTYEPCENCRACHLSQVGSHPDQLSIAPLEDKRTIGVDQIRDLIDRLSLTASGGSYKVVTVAPAEAMTRAAANTLLKILEEPLGDTAFMLVSHASALLPATIRSRCQAVIFPCPPTEMSASWLAPQIPDGGDPAGLLALSSGAPLAALRMAGEDALTRRDALICDVAALVDNTLGPVAAAERWKAHGLADSAWWLTTIVQRVIRQKCSGDDMQARGWPDAMHELGARLDLRGWYRVLDACMQTRRSVASQLSLNEQLALESLALECHEAGRRFASTD